MRIMRVGKVMWVCDTSTRININILHIVYALKAAYNCDKWGASACIFFRYQSNCAAQCNTTRSTCSEI